MHLINASKIKLEYFTSNLNLPPYAILSHRWETDEVLFADIGTLVARTKRGYTKVVSCCKQALKDGYSYVWMDNVCIDKSSSAELSEAINSMYRWYKNASICYAYLSDVTSVGEIQRSEWFTRSWTLQELLAPQNLVFFNQHWRQLGSKSELRESLHKITGIAKPALNGEPLRKFSVAQRMCWASRRFATRVEDRAYSLMGVFDVNMPMLYGEGENAFIRLQEEIVKTLHDHSIFAWTARWNHPTGLLASSPSQFKDSGNIKACEPSVEPESYFITNLGLSIRFSLIPYAMETYIALLDCCSTYDDTSTPAHVYGIFLRRRSRDWEYARIHSGLAGSDRLELFSRRLIQDQKHVRVKRIYVPEHPDDFSNRLQYGFLLTDLAALSSPIDDNASSLTDLTDESHGIKKELLLKEGSTGTAGSYLLTCYDERGYRQCVILKMGFDDEFRPLLLLARRDDSLGPESLTDFARDLIGTASKPNHWIDELSNGQAGIEIRDKSREALWEMHRMCHIHLRRRRGSSTPLPFLGVVIDAELKWLKHEGTVPTYGWVLTIKPYRPTSP